MNDTGSNNLALDIDGVADARSLSGVIAALDEMKPGTIVTEEGLAQFFKRHVVSITRAVERGELPLPSRLFAARVKKEGHYHRTLWIAPHRDTTMICYALSFGQ